MREERGLVNDRDPNMAANSNGEQGSSRNFSVSGNILRLNVGITLITIIESKKKCEGWILFIDTILRVEIYQTANVRHFVSKI